MEERSRFSPAWMSREKSRRITTRFGKSISYEYVPSFPPAVTYPPIHKQVVFHQNHDGEWQRCEAHSEVAVTERFTTPFLV